MTHFDCTIYTATLDEHIHNLSDIWLLHASPSGNWPIAKIPPEDAKAIGSQTGTVLLSADTMNEEAFAELLTEVKKNPATPRLSDSSSVTLKRLVRSLAEPEAN